MGEESVGRAVELRHRHDVAAHLRDVQRRIVNCGLPRGDAQGFDSAFEFGDALLEHVGGRVADSAVPITRHFEVEQRGAVLGAVERVRGRLINRHGDGFRRRVRVEASVNCDGFPLHYRDFACKSAHSVTRTLWAVVVRFAIPEIAAK